MWIISSVVTAPLSSIIIPVQCEEAEARRSSGNRSEPQSYHRVEPDTKAGLSVPGMVLNELRQTTPSLIFTIINTSESFVNKNKRGTINSGPEE